MSIREYTLTDAESKLNDIAGISLFLSAGSCPKELESKLIDHMQDEIETLQGMLSFMRIYPELKAKELAENVTSLEINTNNQVQTA